MPSNTQQKPSLDDAITTAYTAMENEEQPAGQNQPETQDQPAEEVSEGQEQTPEEQPEADGAPEGQKRPEERAAQSSRAAGKAGKAKPGETPQAEEKAPAFWKPTAREKWASLPPEVKQEVARVNREVNKVLQSTVEARRTAESFERTIQPYRAFIQGEPMAVVDNLLKTAVRLQTGSGADRAAVVAALIQGYGVDVNTLADLLEGQQPAQQPQQGQFRDPRVDQLLQHMQQAQQGRATQVQQQAQSELEQFASKAEFFEDVREEMADLLEAARKRNKPITLQAAYEKACMINEEVRPLHEQRKASATASRAATPARGKVSSSSLRNNPALPSSNKGKTRSLDAEIEAAYAELSNAP